MVKKKLIIVLIHNIKKFCELLIITSSRIEFALKYKNDSLLKCNVLFISNISELIESELI